QGGIGRPGNHRAVLTPLIRRGWIAAGNNAERGRLAYGDGTAAWLSDDARQSESSRKRYAVDEHHGIDVEPRLVRAALQLDSIGGREVIVVADEQKKIVGRSGVQRGSDGEAFPLVAERIGVG